MLTQSDPILGQIESGQTPQVDQCVSIQSNQNILAQVQRLQSVLTAELVKSTLLNSDNAQVLERDRIQPKVGKQPRGNNLVALDVTRNSWRREGNVINELTVAETLLAVDELDVFVQELGPLTLEFHSKVVLVVLVFWQFDAYVLQEKVFVWVSDRTKRFKASANLVNTCASDGQIAVNVCFSLTGFFITRFYWLLYYWLLSLNIDI